MPTISPELTLPRDLLERIRRHAAEAYPGECCGFLLGDARLGSGERVVHGIEPLINPDAEAGVLDRYRIAPSDYLRVDRQARVRGWDILGCYHSHPAGEAVPSAVDAAYAWPWYAYLIVSVHDGRAADWRCWILDDAAGPECRFRPITTRVEDAQTR